MSQKFDAYYEGGTVDRWWAAPANLGMVQAKTKRIGRFYKTRAGAMAKAYALGQKQKQESK